MRTGILTIGEVALVDANGEFLGVPDNVEGLIPLTPSFAAAVDAGEEEYAALLAHLLPRGWAWPRNNDSHLMRFVSALAGGFARVHASILLFLTRETDPRTTSDMMFDWERAFGLPDSCTRYAELTLEQRHSILVGRVTGKAGQSPAYLRSLAAAHGYSIEVGEFRQTTCVDPCSRPVFGREWQHAFSVGSPEDTIAVATCKSFCTSPLRTWGNERLECVIRRASPAHSIPIFYYGGQLIFPPEAAAQIPFLLDAGDLTASTSSVLSDGFFYEPAGIIIDGGAP